MKNLSTSNSSHPRTTTAVASPASHDARWISTIVIALVIAIAALMAFEWTLRASGAKPNFRDNQARWSQVREAVQQDVNYDSIALLGASRIRAAISISALETRYPNQAIYPLGYVGRGPCASLQDLADNTEFRGTVIVSMAPNWVDCDPSRFQMHGIVNRYHQDWNWARKIDSRLSNTVTRHLVIFDPHYSIQNILENYLERGEILPRPDYRTTRENRQIEYDYSNISPDELEQLQSRSLHSFLYRQEKGENKGQDRWGAALAIFRNAIDKIEARGGQVIMLRLPTSGPLERAEIEHFPRAEYWDQFSTQLSASVTMHYQDFAELSRFSPPDGNHLDLRESARFTATLFDLAEAEGIDFSRK